MAQHFPTMNQRDIEAWCVEYLRNTLKLTNTRIEVDADFASLGLDSAEAVFLVAALEDWLGIELASNTAMEHPSAAALSRFVAERLAQSSPKPIEG